MEAVLEELMPRLAACLAALSLAACSAPPRIVFERARAAARQDLFRGNTAQAALHWREAVAKLPEGSSFQMKARGCVFRFESFGDSRNVRHMFDQAVKQLEGREECF
jgi:hypothetical protein